MVPYRLSDVLLNIVVLILATNPTFYLVGQPLTGDSTYLLYLYSMRIYDRFTYYLVGR